MNRKFWFRQLSAVVITILFCLTLFSLPANAFVATDYSKLLLTNECNGCDLSGVDLSNKDLYGSALIGANLSGANLSGALLQEATLGKANLTGANLSKADLSAITLSAANLTAANLSKAVLYNARMDGAILTDATWLFGLCYAMDGDYKGWNPYIERHLAIFVNCFLSRAN